MHYCRCFLHSLLSAPLHSSCILLSSSTLTGAANQSIDSSVVTRGEIEGGGGSLHLSVLPWSLLLCTGLSLILGILVILVVLVVHWPLPHPHCPHHSHHVLASSSSSSSLSLLLLLCSGLSLILIVLVILIVHLASSPPVHVHPPSCLSVPALSSVW